MKNLEHGAIFGKLPNVRDTKPYRFNVSFIVVLGTTTPTSGVYGTVYFAKITPNDDDPQENKLEVLKLSEHLFVAIALELEVLKKFGLCNNAAKDEANLISERAKLGQFQFDEMSTPEYL